MLNAVLTNLGQELLTRVLAGETKITFTKIVSSSHTYLTSDIKNIIDLQSPKQEASISNVAFLSDSKVKISADTDNSNLDTGYQLRAMALYAKDSDDNEIIYAVSLSGSTPSYIPDKSQPTGLIFNITVIISETSNIEVTIDPTAYVNITTFNGHVNSAVNSETGVHDIRVKDEHLEYKNGEGEWTEIKAGMPARFHIHVPSNSTTTISKDGIEYVHTTEEIVQDVTEYGNWEISTTNTLQTATQTVNVDDVKIYDITLAYYGGKIKVNYPAGATCTCSLGDVTMTASDTSGSYTFNLSGAGNWVVRIENETQEAEETVSVTEEKEYQLSISFFESTINVNYPQGSTCTITGTKGNVYNAPDTSGVWACVVREADTFTVSCTDGDRTEVATSYITRSGQSQYVTLEYFHYEMWYKLPIDDEDFVTTYSVEISPSYSSYSKYITHKKEDGFLKIIVEKRISSTSSSPAVTVLFMANGRNVWSSVMESLSSKRTGTIDKYYVMTIIIHTRNGRFLIDRSDSDEDIAKAGPALRIASNPTYNPLTIPAVQPYYENEKYYRIITPSYGANIFQNPQECYIYTYYFATRNEDETVRSVYPFNSSDPMFPIRICLTGPPESPEGSSERRLITTDNDWTTWNVTADLTELTWGINNSSSNSTIYYSSAGSYARSPYYNNILNLYTRMKWFGVYPCLFKDGQEVGRLNPNNFAQFEDGSPADITSGNAGDVMISFRYRPMSAYSSFLNHHKSYPSNYNKAFKRGDIINDRIYIGAYEACELNGKLRSLSGKTPVTNKTLAQFRALAQANGRGYDMLGLYQWGFLQSVYTASAGDRSSQTKFGTGFYQGSVQSTGSLDTVGMNRTTDTWTVGASKFFGIENMWGNTWTMLDGCSIEPSGSSVTWYSKTKDFASGGGYEYSTSRSPITSFSFLDVAGAYDGGLWFPTSSASLSGNASSYFCDAVMLLSKQSTFIVGGGIGTSDGNMGVYCFSNQGWTETSAYTGTRLMYVSY